MKRLSQQVYIMYMATYYFWRCHICMQSDPDVSHSVLPFACKLTFEFSISLCHEITIQMHDYATWILSIGDINSQWTTDIP